MAHLAKCDKGRTLSVTLGIKDHATSTPPIRSHEAIEEELTGNEYDIRPDPQADHVDLSKIRGQATDNQKVVEDDPETELAALAELLPEVSKRRPQVSSSAEMALFREEGDAAAKDKVHPSARVEEDVEPPTAPAVAQHKVGLQEVIKTDQEVHEGDSGGGKPESVHSVTEMLNRQARGDTAGIPASMLPVADAFLGDSGNYYEDPGKPADATSLDDFPSSDNVHEDDQLPNPGARREGNIPEEFINSGQSISTATQTHEVRMPMHLPNFKPATGCTNASDFIVRCFVARLRSGITVIKHGRSRWCKSRLRVLQIHPDGRSLTWKPAEGEPATSRKPPKLDLSSCLEVRHAWSPDPHNPMYTGTPILRQKCEAANAHKSFALIFKHRTVDITAVTADQCKVLMEGFSALCFRLQVASLAGSRSGSVKNKTARSMPDEDGVSVTASATLTNTSTPKNR